MTPKAEGLWKPPTDGDHVLSSGTVVRERQTLTRHSSPSFGTPPRASNGTETVAVQ